MHMSYGNDKPPSSTGSGEVDIANDPASSGFFTNDFKKHEDLKTMLDGNKDNLKLEAMKRIIGMVAKGKDASDLFPAVVKNVVSKNLEVKKLVYVYLTRYAEEQQDLALLSISTFQRALKDPNQLIRASALRVLSSIRVPVIVPIMMLAIKEAVMDMSPYVRKTAAHAIPKLYSLDPEQKDQLIEVIEKLLADKTTLVAGSAIQAFEEVCPERIDLIHKNYRKLCNLLVDVEEWGQVVIINMLTRYCRTQFVNPNQAEACEESDQHFYDESDKEEEEEEEKDDTPVKKVYVMDSDHRLLLRQTKPLLNSRNAAVVMSVAQLYFHCAPKAEVGTVGKALIRLLRSHKEVQYVVLSNIATMTIHRKGMFEPYLKSFYVRSNDPTHVKLLKLEILTSLATETNISTILREFQTYVTSSDKAFAAATIQAIGRCASNIAEITDACLNGLVHLMSNRDEAVVAESVVVIKKLLQMQPSEHKDIIIHMAKMVDNITVPMARASILWLIGEYSERVPKIAPDVLRKMAKGFVSEEDIVKLQILNLAAKMCITNPKQTKLLCQYVLNLAKYDQNYDIRDRSRFLRQLVLPSGEKAGILSKYIKKIFLATKPAPVLESKFKDRDQYQLGTLSHLLNTKAHGYQELPEFPETAPDSSVRNVEVPLPWSDLTRNNKKSKKKSTSSEHFYSDDESSPDDELSKSSDESSEEEDSNEENSSGEYSEVSGDSHAVNNAAESSEDEDDDDEEDEEDDDEDEDEEDDEDEDDSSSSEEESSSEEDSDESVKESRKSKKLKPNIKNKPDPPKKNSDLLLDIDDLCSVDNNSVIAATPSAGQDILTPMLASLDLSTPAPSVKPTVNYTLGPPIVPSKSYDLLNRMTANGLTVKYCFTRTISIFNPKMTSIELTITNDSEKPMTNIKIGTKKAQPGMEIHNFPDINVLAVGATTSVLMAINFNDTTQPAQFELCAGDLKYNVKISAPVGELLQPYTINESEFKLQKSKLTGMTENSVNVELAPNHRTAESLRMCIHQVTNVLQVPSADENVYYFAGKTLATQVLLLITVQANSEEGTAKVTVNCEKLVIGSMMTKDIQHILSKTA